MKSRQAEHAAIHWPRSPQALLGIEALVWNIQTAQIDVRPNTCGTRDRDCSEGARRMIETDPSDVTNRRQHQSSSATSARSHQKKKPLESCACIFCGISHSLDSHRGQHPGATQPSAHHILRESLTIAYRYSTAQLILKPLHSPRCFINARRSRMSTASSRICHSMTKSGR